MGISWLHAKLQYILNADEQRQTLSAGHTVAIQMCHMRRGVSGLRVGWMHTLNAELRGAMDNLAYFAMPSTIIQEACTQMLLDKAFVTSYLKENQQRLAQSYDTLTGMDSGGLIITHISPEPWQVMRLQRLDPQLKHCQAKTMFKDPSKTDALQLLACQRCAVNCKHSSRSLRIDWSHVSGLSTYGCPIYP